MALGDISAIFRSGGGAIGAFGQHLPDVFIRRVEERVEGSVLRRIVFPQSEIPLLAREDQTNEHDLDYVNMPDRLVHQGLDASLQSGHFALVAPRQARLLPGLETRGGSGSKF